MFLQHTPFYPDSWRRYDELTFDRPWSINTNNNQVYINLIYNFFIYNNNNNHESKNSIKNSEIISDSLFCEFNKFFFFISNRSIIA